MPGTCIGLIANCGETKTLDLVDGVRSYCQKHELDWTVLILDRDGERTIDNQPVEARQLHGVISWLGHLSAWKDRDLFNKLPQVYFGHKALGHPHQGPSVQMELDAHAIGALVAEHAAEAGYRHAAVIGMARNPLAELESGVLQVAEQRGLSVSRFDPHQDGTPDTAAAHDQALVTWVRALPKPALLFFHVDQRAIWHRNLLQKHGIRIPDDVGILGMQDNRGKCEATAPTLSSVHLTLRMQGRDAARCLHRLMHGSELSSADMQIRPLRITRRQSSHRKILLSQQLQALKSFICADLARPFDAQALAAAIDMSPSACRRLVQREKGITPKAWYTQLRMEAAKSLLGEPALSISEVAQRCGYASSAALSHAFRRVYAMSPKDFRAIISQVD